jgi:ubiquinone/menaquinone biosynthesis C-methylase UbiE
MTDTPPIDRPTAATRDHYSKSVDADAWWEAHFDQAAGEVQSFLGGDGISLQGKRVADIGCGDGIIDLGLAVQAEPGRLIGFDIQPTDVDALTDLARQRLSIERLPDALSFVTCGATSIPADDDIFDFAVSWSAFEHIADPHAVLKEIRRILTNQGVLFIQLWPFYDSAHGTHLVDWFPEGFAQFEHTDEEIIRRMRSSGDQNMAAEMLEIYRTLNKITLDELHEAVRGAGFKVVKVSLSTETLHIPDSVAHASLSRLAISGVKLLAIPDQSIAHNAPPAAEEPIAAEPAPVEDELAPVEPPPAAAPTTGARLVQSLRAGLGKLDELLSRFDHD